MSREFRSGQLVMVIDPTSEFYEAKGRIVGKTRGVEQYSVELAVNSGGDRDEARRFPVMRLAFGGDSLVAVDR